MRFHSAVILTMALGAAVPDPAAAQHLTAPDRRQVEAELVEFMQAVASAMRSADAEQILSLYGRPDVFVNIEDGEVVPYERMAAEVREFTARVSGIDVRWVGEPRFVILDRDAAVIYGFHHFAGAEGFPAHTGVWTGVVQRIEGRWRIVHAHGSDASPQAAPSSPP